MRLFNLELLGNIILPGLLSSTIWSALIALVAGSVVGAIVGAIRHNVKQTLLPAIAGSFFGTMVFCLLPIYSVPGIVGGGPYGGIWIMFIAMMTLPVGAIGGAIAGSLVGPTLYKEQQKKVLLGLLAGTYAMMTLVMFASISLHCSRRNTLPDYCAQAGYPHQRP